jgi:hypothetical protein
MKNEQVQMTLLAFAAGMAMGILTSINFYRLMQHDPTHEWESIVDNYTREKFKSQNLPVTFKKLEGGGWSISNANQTVTFSRWREGR